MWGIITPTETDYDRWGGEEMVRDVSIIAAKLGRGARQMTQRRK